MLERLEDELEKAAAASVTADAALPKLVSLLGTGNDEARAVLAALGWRTVAAADAPPVWRKGRDKRRPRRPEPGRPDSHFAAMLLPSNE